MPSPKATTACSFCGRANDPDSRFCMDCGKPLSASAARIVLRPAAERGRGEAARAPDACGACGAPYDRDTDLFCSRCGHRLRAAGPEPSSERGPRTAVLGARSRESGPRVALLDDAGEVKATYTMDRGEAVIGRAEADLRFDDPYLSPVHARLESRGGELWIRDLGSRNGTWVFLDKPATLADGDVVLVGSQLLRFRRLGFPGPRQPEGDGTRAVGSLAPSADVAVLEQLRADGSVRDCFHLSPARAVTLGRESGEWLFPYDQTMSGRHAEIRSQDGEFVLHDTGSRNGVAVAVRGERRLAEGQRVLVGDQVLRVEQLA